MRIGLAVLVIALGVLLTTIEPQINGFDFGLSTGLSAFYTDGTPITAMGYYFPYANHENYLSTRGAFGNGDSYWEADLHFGYPLKLGSRFEINFLVDIFNLFNNQG